MIKSKLLISPVIRNFAIASILIVFALSIIVWFSEIRAQKVLEEFQTTSIHRDIAAVIRGQADNIILYDTVDTDSLIYELRDLRGLRSLKLDRTNITDTGMNYIKDIPDLRILIINGAQHIDDRGIDAIAGHPNIEALSLYNPQITDAGVASLKRLSKLNTLSLMYSNRTASYLTDKALDNMVEI